MNCLGINGSELQEAREYYAELMDPFTRVFGVLHSYAYVFLCVVGVLANLSIVVVLLRPQMRKSPFNLFLICIALCDATLMATYLLYKHVEFCHPWFFSHTWMLYTTFYAIFSVFVHSASLWLTVNMAVLRYLVLYRGSSSNSRLPPVNGFPAALVAIVLAIIIAFAGSFLNMLRYTISNGGEIAVPEHCLVSKYSSYWHADDRFDRWDLTQPTWWSCQYERNNYWLVAWILKIVPCVLLTVFMTLLVRMLVEARERRSRLCGVGSGNSQAERTTAMLTCIVAVFLITELPQGIMSLAAGANPRLIFSVSSLGNFFDLLSLINSSVNFVLCALMSHVFRREFLNTFGMCCPHTSESAQHSVSAKPSNRNIFSSFGALKSKRGTFVAVPTMPTDELSSQRSPSHSL